MLKRACWIAGLLVACGSTAVRAGGLTSLEILGEATVPGTTVFEGAPVGGLSGLAFDPGSGEYLALSDDRSEHGPARFYRLAIDLPAMDPAAPLAMRPPVVTIKAVTTLLAKNGGPFPRRALDPEGIALGKERIYVSSEGEAPIGQAPFVAEFDLAGRFLRELPLPDRYRPRLGQSVGVRDNLGFEALSLTPDGRYLFSGAENGLAQESPATAPGVSSRTRLLRWDLEAGGNPQELFYVVEAVSRTPPEPVDVMMNGMVEILALDRDHLLTLERQWVPGVGLEIKLFAVDLAGLEDVSSYDAPASPAASAASAASAGRPASAKDEVATARKTLLLNFADLGVPIDNFEGMAFGPALADGRRTLYIVSDDNFNSDRQKSFVLALAAGFEPLTIAALQGGEHRSPLAGRWVAAVEGVVTATEDSPRSKGFWLESTAPDADPATSEGIYVAWEGGFSLHPGDRVRVGGRLEEVAVPANALPVTTLRLVALEPLAAGGPSLPPPVRLVASRRIPTQVDDDGLTAFDPATDAIDFWESLEGMRVEVPPGSVVGPTRAFGDVVLLADGADTAGALRTPAGGVRQPAEGRMFERIFLSRRIAGRMPDFEVGDRIDSPLTGIVDYGFSSYRVQLLQSPAMPGAKPADHSCGERTKLSQKAGTLTLATFNVENFSLANAGERMQRVGRSIVEGLASPAIVGLEEVQDDSGPADDGVVTSRATLDALVAAIVATGGPRYDWLAIDPENNRDGGQPGGNIRVALLFDPARVEPVRRGEARPLDAVEIVGRGRTMGLSLSPGRLAPGSSAFDLRTDEGVRKSLVAEFRAGGKPLFVIVNHWTSKWDDDRAFGARQPPLAPTAAKRLAQAKVVRGFVDRLLAGEDSARVVVLGDLNESETSPGVAALGAPPMANLVAGVAAADRYSFNFEGVSEVIDHVVISPALAPGAETDIVHLNTHCPDSARTSDHDAVVVRLAIR